MKSWNYIVYTRKKLKERWEKLFNEREQFSKQLSKFKITELREKLEYYKEKVKELQNKSNEIEYLKQQIKELEKKDYSEYDFDIDREQIIKIKEQELKFLKNKLNKLETK